MISAIRIRTIIVSVGFLGPLAACVSSQAIEAGGPDRLTVQRLPPLILPPDIALKPVQPGQPRPARATLLGKTLDVLFGGPAKRSKLEAIIIERAGRAAPGIRSSIGDVKTYTVAKGRITQTILAAPEGDGRVARTIIEG